MLTITALLILFLACLGQGASPSQWRSRAIYQVLTDRFARSDGSTTAWCDTGSRTYCGGSWKGIVDHLDYIQGMGFDAIWISPITLQLQQSTMYGQSYHGYWQQDLYSVNGNFGHADDLKALSAALHAKGMYLMVDVVVNHVGWNGSPQSVNYTAFRPFNNESYYHQYCQVDYSNSTSVVSCWLGDTNVPLPDLKTESPAVMTGYQKWISQLLANYSIDGLRLDTVSEVNPQFWPGFVQAAKNSYMVGEVYDQNVTNVCSYQKTYDLPGVLNYPTYFPLTAAFQSPTGNMSALVSTIDAVKSTCGNPSLLGSFSENADVPRFAQLNGDLAAAQNLIAYTILADGIPILYQGQEQHYSSYGGSGDPFNREALWFSGYNTTAPLYTLSKQLLALRKWAGKLDDGYWGYNAWPIYHDNNTIVMRKGFKDKQVLAVLTNEGGQGQPYNVTLLPYKSGATKGQVWLDLMDCKTTIMADAQQNLVVNITAGLPRILFPKIALRTSGICGQ